MRLLLAFIAFVLIAPTAAEAAERPVSWTTTTPGYFPDNDDRELPITVFVDDCGTNRDRQRVDVQRSATTVTISVFDAEPDAEICPAVARELELDVDLGGRLGRRAIIDGSIGLEVYSREQAIPFGPADKSKPIPSQRSYRLAYQGCTALGAERVRFAVRRSRRAVTITALRRTRSATPYGGTCQRTRIVARVPLGGRLGQRTIRDGSRSRD